jgi:hypothetical protein
MKLKLFENFEEEYSKNVEIEITKIEPDERSNKTKIKYHVNYQITVDDNLMEIEGDLKPYNTGRSDEFDFEPTYFMDDETEEYYDKNNEDIKKQIMNHFYASKNDF